MFLSSTLRVVNGFGGNSDVRYVHVPDGVTTIGNEAFNGSSLVSIDLPSHLDFIDEYAFYYCQSLTRVGMPTTLDTMGEGCFKYCNQLTSIDIPNDLRTIPEYAFFMCTTLSNITWGDAVEVIDTAAFGDCSFTELTLPPTLRAIREVAFIGDYNGRLGKVVFSAPVDTIEMEAFYSQSLSMMQLKNSLPPVTTDDGCLDGANVDTILIPCGSLNAWLADSYWGQFAAKYREDCSDIDDVYHDNIKISSQGNLISIQGIQGESVYVFDVVGRQLYHTANASDIETVNVPSEGVYIVKVGNNRAKKIVAIK